MDSCAIDKDGKLLDTTDIKWFNDADETHLLPPSSAGTHIDTNGFQLVLGHSHHVKSIGVIRSAMKDKHSIISISWACHPEWPKYYLK